MLEYPFFGKHGRGAACNALILNEFDAFEHEHGPRQGNLWPIARRSWVRGRGGCQHPLVQSILVYHETQMYDADDETNDREGQGNMADFERASSFALLNLLLQSLRLRRFRPGAKETVGLLGVWVLFAL